MTFRARIEFERVILESVNKNYTIDKYLHGLSYPAIDEWRTRSKAPQKLVDVLKKVVDAMTSYKKNSGYSFSPEILKNLNSEGFLQEIKSIFDEMLIF